jgi:hypothetical protein
MKTHFEIDLPLLLNQQQQPKTVNGLSTLFLMVNPFLIFISTTKSYVDFNR